MTTECVKENYFLFPDVKLSFFKALNDRNFIHNPIDYEAFIGENRGLKDEHEKAFKAGECLPDREHAM